MANLPLQPGIIESTKVHGDLAGELGKATRVKRARNYYGIMVIRYAELDLTVGNMVSIGIQKLQGSVKPQATK